MKTQPARERRIRREMGAVDAKVMVTTEFMHPRMAELLGLLPPFLGAASESRAGLVRFLDRAVCGLRRLRTDTVRGFVALYVVAGLRRWRRRTLHHAREHARIADWLARVHAASAHDPGLGAELLANQRLIKGYSDTHERGLGKYARVMETAERLRGRRDAASWVRGLREAALRNEQGLALNGALRHGECAS